MVSVGESTYGRRMATEPVYPEVSSAGDLVVPVRPPEVRESVAVEDYDGTVVGLRVVALQPAFWVFDLRAVSEKYRDKRGREVVDVAPEASYYKLGCGCPGQPLRSSIVFVERPPLQ